MIRFIFAHFILFYFYNFLYYQFKLVIIIFSNTKVKIMSSKVYQMHEAVPPSKQPTVAEAMVNHKNNVNNYGYDRRFGKLDTTPLETFEKPVQSWDVHVYFNSKSEEETTFALTLRWESLHKFPNITVNRPYSFPIGPHPSAMWSAELHTPTQMSQYLSWFCTRKGNLSALVHPNTGDPYRDHNDFCYWIGKPLPLRLEIFKTSREQKL